MPHLSPPPPPSRFRSKGRWYVPGEAPRGAEANAPGPNPSDYQRGHAQSLLRGSRYVPVVLVHGALCGVRLGAERLWATTTITRPTCPPSVCCLSMICWPETDTDTLVGVEEGGWRFVISGSVQREP